MVFPSPFESTDEEALRQVSWLAHCLTMDLAEPEHKHKKNNNNNNKKISGEIGMEGFKNKRVEPI